MQTMAPVLELETSTSRQTVIQFSDRFDAEPYRSLCGRTRHWAVAAGYAYHAETERGLPTYSVYWEKVRMGLEALERGAEWALWVDDDATINRADMQTEDFLARFPDRSLLIGVQAELEDHGITATHYHNWGVWIVRNGAWSRALLRQMLQPDGRCADLHRAAKLGNPEQDCFARFVHESTVALVYPFNALGRNLDTLALNRSTLARLGEPHNMGFNCICQTGQTCSPWFLHFMQATNRPSSSPLTSTFTPTSHYHPRWPPSRMLTHYMAILTTAQATKSQAGIVPARLDRVISVDLAPKSPRERWFMFTYNCSVIAQPTAAAPGARLLAMSATFAYAMAHRCAFFVDWLAPASAPGWAELYTGAVRPPPPGLRPTLYSGHVSALDPFAVEGVLFRSGPQAQQALQALVRSEGVAQEAIDDAQATFRRRVRLRPWAHVLTGGLGGRGGRDEPLRGSAAWAWDARGETMCGRVPCVDVLKYDPALDPNYIGE